MKIQQFTDLHLDINADCQDFKEKTNFKIDPSVDVIVITGDTFNDARKTVDWIHYVFIEKMQAHQHLFYIFGNHEFYECDMQTAYEYALSLNHTQITFLHKDMCVNHKGVWFIGDTLWTDYQFGLDKSLNKMHCNSSMSDHRYIRTAPDVPADLEPYDTKMGLTLYKRVSNKLFHPDDAEVAHRWTLHAFQECLKAHPDDKFVILSHHSPTSLSIHSNFYGSRINSAYCSDILGRDTETYKNVVFWFHGHVHHSVDIEIFDTRVIANPFGYMKWYGGHLENDFFNYNKIVLLNTDTIL